MQLVQIDAQAVHPIDQFASVRLSGGRVAHLSSRAQVVVMSLAPGGEIGHHQAVVPQLFVVVTGAGWVGDASRAQFPISPGQAAFWSAGEWHSAGSAEGMTALVLESETLALDDQT